MDFVMKGLAAASVAAVGYGMYRVFNVIQEMKEDIKDMQVVLADYAGKSDY